MIPVESVLPVDDIQGDVLAGFRKDHETFLFFRILDVSVAKASLRELLPRISPLCDVGAFNALFRAVCARRGEIRGTITATWVNIAFTASGLARLTTQNEVRRFADNSFQLGLTRRSRFIGDPTNQSNEGHPSNWLFGGPTNPVDVVVLVAADDQRALDATMATCEEVLTRGASPGLQIAWRESCHARPDRLGHEHFGFKDGVSQPGVRGRLAEGTYLTPREVRFDPDDPRTLMYSRRGQPLIWPGQFVLGLERQRPSFSDPAPLPSLPVFPGWARHGSTLVIRRLRQDTARFERFVDQAAYDLARRHGFADMTAERLAALLVGRWQSGAPLVRVPEGDDEQLGSADGPNNAFGYLNEKPPLPTIPGVPPDVFPPPRPDAGGRLCPHGAHIRKMNPREQAARGIGGRDALTHMILRRGLTFDHTNDDPAASVPEDKGIMFACYQASIPQGFEFLSALWANSSTRPLPDPGGMDLLIGRQRAASGSTGRSLVLVGQDDHRFELATTEDWVVATGGGYFFSPSISALRDALTRE